MVAGWGSDRWGRRRVALVFILGQVGWTLAYYSVSGPLLVVAWIGRIFMALGANVTLSAFGVELFPTSSRSTAAGMRLVFVTLGGSLGLLLEALLYGVVASHWVAIGALATLALPGALPRGPVFPRDGWPDAGRHRPRAGLSRTARPQRAQAAYSTAVAAPSTTCFNVWLAVKRTTRRAAIAAAAPVRGLRPTRARLARTRNVPKRRRITGSPCCKPSLTVARIASTASLAWAVRACGVLGNPPDDVHFTHATLLVRACETSACLCPPRSTWEAHTLGRSREGQAKHATGMGCQGDCAEAPCSSTAGTPGSKLLALRAGW